MNQSMNQRDMFFKWLYYAGAVLLLVLVQSLVLNRISVWAVCLLYTSDAADD